MSPLSRARKASGAPQTPTTLRKQAHAYPHTDSRTGIFPIARKSAHTGASQRVLLAFFHPVVVSVLILLQTVHTMSNSTGAQNSQSGLISSSFMVSKRLTFCTAPPVLITSRPYSIAGVTGFHRGTKPTVTGFSQPERRIKPVPHKNISASRMHIDPKMPKDANASVRIPDGTTTKSSARRTRAVAQVASSRKRYLLMNEHRKYFVSPDVVLKMVL